MARKSGNPRPEPARAMRQRAVLIAILVLAAVLRFVPLGLREPRFHHLDEWDFALSAREMLATGDLNPHRFHHPGLYRYGIALVYPAAGVLLGPFVEPEVAKQWMPYIGGRLISAALGVVSVWLVFALGRRLMPLGGAAMAALVLALMPLHVKFAHIAKPDVMMAMWVALATLLAWRIAEAPSRRLYVLAGLCVGLAASSKYNGVVACVPIVAAHLVAPGQTPWFKRLVAPNLWLAGLCSIAAFAATSPYTVLDFQTVRGELASGYAFIVTGSEDEAAHRGFALVEFGKGAAVWIGAVPLLLMVAGGAVWWRTNRKALWVVGSLVAAYLLLIAGWAFRQAHYLMPIVPAVATMAAAPVASLWPKRRRLAMALVALALLPGAAISVREVVRFWRADTKTAAFLWLRSDPRARRGLILRDYDALWDTAGKELKVKNPGFEFYDVVGRDHLKRRGITHFVLSDGVADFTLMPPARAQRRGARREELLACGDLLASVPAGWWRDGPDIEIYAVKASLLQAFAAEWAREARDLTAKLAGLAQKLARQPTDPGLHMAAGRLEARLAEVRGEREALGRALRHFERAARLDPAVGDAHYNLGTMHLRLAILVGPRGNPDQLPPEVLRRLQRAGAAELDRAGTALRKAIELDPANADAHFNLAYVLLVGASAADPGECDRLFHKARTLDPEIGPIERGPRPVH